MIIDSSAAVAMMRGEDDYEIYVDAIESANAVRISVASILELSIVMGPGRRGEVDEFLSRLGALPVAVDLEQLGVARDAHYRFGRGSGSPAKLNFGDCFSYAAAICSGEPLLYKGSDFVHTDVVSALSTP